MPQHSSFDDAVHKQFFKNENPKGESALTTFACRSAPNLGVEPDPIEVINYGDSRLHALALHPSGGKIAMAQERAGVKVLNRSSGKVRADEVERYSVLQVRDGAKGVAFTRDGKQLVVTTPINEVLFFDLSGPN